MSGDNHNQAGGIIFDPNTDEPEPLPLFEVGQRIRIGEHIVTVTAIHPRDDDGGQRFEVSS